MEEEEERMLQEVLYNSLNNRHKTELISYITGIKLNQSQTHKKIKL